eukprot:1197722-Rhodomonas_salina.1
MPRAFWGSLGQAARAGQARSGVLCRLLSWSAMLWLAKATDCVRRHPCSPTHRPSPHQPDHPASPKPDAPTPHPDTLQEPPNRTPCQPPTRMLSLQLTALLRMGSPLEGEPGFSRRAH